MTEEHVLVVGASSSIGTEIIREIAHAEMIVHAQHRSKAEALQHLAKSVPARINTIQADLASEVDVAALISSVEAHCPAPRKIVFLAAPRFSLTRFKDQEWSEYQAQLDVQLRSSVQICRRFLPKMSKADKIVFVLSSYTIGAPPAAMAAYVAAKYAVLGLMKVLAAEYAAKRICINAVSPSMVETGYLVDIPSKLVEITAEAHPHKRNATPGDVAPLVAFLLSDASNFISGANMPITGGAS